MSKLTRIAIADDHQLVRHGISLILNNHPNFQVVFEAENGRQLLDQMDEHRPDLVLLDIEMPVLTGPDTLIELRAKYPDLPVLILTMHKSEAFISHMMELGANGYLLKNTEPEEVIRAIQKVINTGYYFSDLVSIAMLKGLSNPDSKGVDAASHAGLTRREVEVLSCICEQMTSKEIADKLFVSQKTVEGYRKVLMQKIGARNMAGLVMYAVKNKIVVM